MRRKCSLATLVPLLLCGCVSPQASLRGDFAQITPAQASDPQWRGASVRWGGVVVGTRLSDAGQCAEIAQFPLDQFTQKPYRIMPGGNDGLLQGLIATSNSAKAAAAPRFLACPDRSLGPDAIRVGTVVTVVGTLQAAQIFEVQDRLCVNARQIEVSSVPDYSGSMHARSWHTCFVSLPTIEVTTARIWQEMPSQHYASAR